MAHNILSINEMYLPFLYLYAEIHYRFFPFLPSLLFKREPEVLFDIPNRIGPGDDLPVLLIINDLGRFPAEPEQVTISVSNPLQGTTLHRFSKLIQYEIDLPFKRFQQAFIFPVPKSELPFGKLYINAKVTLKNQRRMWTVLNDNLNTSSKHAFGCFRSDNSLPGSDLCLYGDIHVHSQFSQSHVEFGPPLEVIDRMAKSCGLSFIGITDHSYDLACKIDNYLIEDQLLERWKLQKKILADQSRFQTIMLQGEEISCQNNQGATVHLGALGTSEFIPGSRDGARRKLYFKQQLTIKQAINEIHRQGGIAFASHPGSQASLLKRLFLHRGEWSTRDLCVPIDGIQAFNNGLNKSWTKGKELWINILRQGHRVPLFAGNDAHGDFSRYRAVEKPFFRIHENFQRFMGYGKTGIYGKATTSKGILQLLKQGSTFITTGPYLSINYSKNPTDFLISNAPSQKPINTIYINALSTPEFGRLEKITLYSGSFHGEKHEENILVSILKEKSYAVQIPFDTVNLLPGNYLRAEVATILEDGERRIAFTSCCFIK